MDYALHGNEWHLLNSLSPGGEGPPCYMPTVAAPAQQGFNRVEVRGEGNENHPHPTRHCECSGEAGGLNPPPQRLCRKVISESLGILNLQVFNNKRFLASLEMTNTA
jgi:hypothetical protein